MKPRLTFASNCQKNDATWFLDIGLHHLLNKGNRTLVVATTNTGNETLQEQSTAEEQGQYRLVKYLEDCRMKGRQHLGRL